MTVLGRANVTIISQKIRKKYLNIFNEKYGGENSHHFNEKNMRYDLLTKNYIQIIYAIKNNTISH